MLFISKNNVYIIEDCVFNYPSQRALASMEGNGNNSMLTLKKLTLIGAAKGSLIPGLGFNYIHFEEIISAKVCLCQQVKLKTIY